MAKGINQKGKILYLEKILRETSETHPCTMQEIIGRLQENGVSAERKSIYDDMEVLRSFGMDIKFKKRKVYRILCCRRSCRRERKYIHYRNEWCKSGRLCKKQCWSRE
ncbi:MAG: hypothetical protein ACLT8I_04280 [Blautia faecis]